MTREPLYNLVFLLPILLVYEGALLYSLSQGQAPPAAGAHVWMKVLLDGLGYEGLYLPPLILVLIFLGWHVVDGRPWRVGPVVLGGMLLECIVLALVLVSLMHVVLGLMGVAVGTLRPIPFRYVVMYLGAGIYEETLFRLFLLTLLLYAGLAVGLPRKPAVTVAVSASAVLFALAHHLGPGQETWSAARLVWRSVGGLFFGVVYVTRGFGIAVGSHAAFDILVG